MTTKMSKNDNELHRISETGQAYHQFTPATYQDSAGLLDHEQRHFEVGMSRWTIGGYFNDNEYIMNPSHDCELGNESDNIVISPWSTQPVIPHFSLTSPSGMMSLFDAGTTYAPTFGALTPSLITEADYSTHAHIHSHEDAHIVDPPFGEDVSVSAKFKHIVHRDRVHCAWTGCEKTFGRLQDLVRHHNSVHELTTPFWCPVSSCSRSESFPHHRRPFPRKDKLDSHLKKVHRFDFSHSEMSVVQADQAVGGNESADAEWATDSSGVNPFIQPYSVGALPNLHDYASIDSFDNFLVPAAGHEVPNLGSVSTANWFDGINSVSSFDMFSNSDQTSVADVCTSTGRPDVMCDPQNIFGEDMLFAGNGYVG
jgi:hypothetical protein